MLDEPELRARIAEAAWIRIDPATLRLRVGECAAFYRELALELNVGWAAVRLRIPMKYRPTAAEEEAHKRIRDQQLPAAHCCGCGRPGCQDCARLERELGEFSDEELRETITHATNVGGLEYLDLHHEMRRRRNMATDG